MPEQSMEHEEMLDEAIDRKMSADLVAMAAENANYEHSIIRGAAGSGSRACKRCGSLVQTADFSLHDHWHEVYTMRIEELQTAVSGLSSSLMLAHSLIDFMDDRARRRYNQRNNMDSIAGTILPRGSDLR